MFNKKSITKRASGLLLLFILIVPLASCKIYSLNGASIDYSQIKNISIANFYNEAAGGPVNMSQVLTERLKEYYQQNSALKIASGGVEGDLQLQGSIVGYQLSPIAVTATQPGQPDQAALNRLTIRVKAKFVNNKNEEQNFDQEFAFYRDFPQSQSLSDVEGQLVPIILDQIVLDIFNRSVANW